MNKFSSLLLLIIFHISAPSTAQSQFEESVRRILDDPSRGSSYLINYSQPLVTAFGTISASAIFNRAETKSFPHFDLGVSYIHLNLPQKSRVFYWNDSQVPTVFGEPSTPDEIIPGTGISSLNIPQLQLNLGLAGDLELMLRTWPLLKVEGLGEVRFSGVGIKYGLSELVTSAEFPIDLSVQASYHLLGVSNWIDAATFAMNIQSSKSLPGLPLSIFSGIGYEVTSMTMRTDDLAGIGENGAGDVKLRGQNGLRFIIGTNLHLWFLTIFADYEFGYQNALAMGMKIVL